MGTYNNGIMGAFSGKIGTVVGVNWRGIDVMRSLPKKSKRKPTASQLLQREKFSFVNDFLLPINPLLNYYFASNDIGPTRLNQAMSYHMKHAVNYVAPNFEIVFNRVQITKGTLIGFQNPTAAAIGGNQMKFNWEDNSNQSEAKPTDGMIVVIYEPVSSMFYYQTNAGNREDTSAIITLPNLFTGLTIHSWIGIASTDEKSYATSIYMGEVEVS